VFYEQYAILELKALKISEIILHEVKYLPNEDIVHITLRLINLELKESNLLSIVHQAIMDAMAL
jgi:hypothetical protein